MTRPTSEQRRYERLLERQRRGFELDAGEAFELAQHQANLPSARLERQALDELKTWFDRAPSEAEQQLLTRLERAALIRARNTSRASLRLLISKESPPVAAMRGSIRRGPIWRDSVWHRSWRALATHKRQAILALGCVLASAGALAFGARRFIAPTERANTALAESRVQSVEAARTSLPPPPNEAPLLATAPAQEPNVAPTLREHTRSTDSVKSRPSGSVVGTRHLESSPSDLLARAREALRQHDAKRALSHYQELVRRFPKSSEAASVRITIAQLELQSGSAKQALVGFERYLAHGGALGPEALAGKVQALSALGRNAHAKQAMREYVTRFPDEVHSKGYRRALGL